MDESTIYKKLFIKFKPSFLKVENESHLHSNHAQSPKSGNSHFAITIKSQALNKLNRIEGQRKNRQETIGQIMHILCSIQNP